MKDLFNEMERIRVIKMKKEGAKDEEVETDKGRVGEGAI